MATIYIPKPSRLVELLEQVRRIADELAEVAPSSLHGMVLHPEAGGVLKFEWRGKNVQD